MRVIAKSSHLRGILVSIDLIKLHRWEVGTWHGENKFGLPLLIHQLNSQVSYWVYMEVLEMEVIEL